MTYSSLWITCTIYLDEVKEHSKKCKAFFTMPEDCIEIIEININSAMEISILSEYDDIMYAFIVLALFNIKYEDI